MSAAARETEWQRRKRRERERAEHVATHGPGCEICGNVPKLGLNEDHEHGKSGAHRGWLCGRCNQGLPYWIRPAWLAKAAIYLLTRGGSPLTPAARIALEHLRAAADYLEARS